MGNGYLLPWMDRRFIQRHFYLKLQGIHRSCSSKIYYWHHLFGGAINYYHQMKIIKPLSGNCSVGLGEPERGRKSIESLQRTAFILCKLALSLPYAHINLHWKYQSHVLSIWIYAIHENHPLQIVLSYISPLVFSKDL